MNVSLVKLNEKKLFRVRLIFEKNDSIFISFKLIVTNKKISKVKAKFVQVANRNL